MNNNEEACDNECIVRRGAKEEKYMAVASSPLQKPSNGSSTTITKPQKRHTPTQTKEQGQLTLVLLNFNQAVQKGGLKETQNSARVEEVVIMLALS
jgi:hypothetical protein